MKKNYLISLVALAILVLVLVATTVTAKAASPDAEDVPPPSVSEETVTENTSPDTSVSTETPSDTDELPTETDKWDYKAFLVKYGPTVFDAAVVITTAIIAILYKTKIVPLLNGLVTFSKAAQGSISGEVSSLKAENERFVNDMKETVLTSVEAFNVAVKQFDTVSKELLLVERENRVIIRAVACLVTEVKEGFMNVQLPQYAKDKIMAAVATAEAAIGGLDYEETVD